MTLDVLIIGGGPAGATTAILLAEAGWSVGLIEKKHFPRRKVCGEFISAASMPLIQHLGLEHLFIEQGGPEVKKVGLYSDEVVLTASMPTGTLILNQWGRALGREYLDTALIKAAQLKGARIWQPCEAISLVRNRDLYVCLAKQDNQPIEVKASLVIMANGSWEKGIIQPQWQPHAPSDLLAFKAHFTQCTLDANLMPLFAFPGGYGGLVHSTNHKVTLSCCIRRDTLKDLRRKHPGLQAAEVVFNYIKTHCRGVAEVFAHAHREGNWLASGPLRPGIRFCYKEGIFYVGNTAGEAHPVIAEGISMAMQSAWLLSQVLIRNKENKDLDAIGSLYTKQWRKHFVYRIRASSLFARAAMMTGPSRSLILLIIRLFPFILTFGAKLSGKNQQLAPISKH